MPVAGVVYWPLPGCVFDVLAPLGMTHAPPAGRGELQARLDCAMQTVTVKYNRLEEVEMSSVRTALIEERSRFCLFVSCIKPFVVRCSFLVCRNVRLTGLPQCCLKTAVYFVCLTGCCC